MKVVITDKLGIACKVSKVNSQLSHHWHFSQTDNLLQTQPILSLHISEAILIVCPPSVKVLCTITPSLKYGPSPSIVHVAPDREGLQDTTIGTHSCINCIIDSVTGNGHLNAAPKFHRTRSAFCTSLKLSFGRNHTL